MRDTSTASPFNSIPRDTTANHHKGPTQTESQSSPPEANPKQVQATTKNPGHQTAAPPSTAPITSIPIVSGPTRDAAFVLDEAAEEAVVDASEDDEGEFEDVDRAAGAVEVIESTLVEFARDVAFALVVAVKWVEGTGLSTRRIRTTR